MADLELTREQVNELENRLDAVKSAIADLQTALYGIERMDDELLGDLLNGFGAAEWAESLDTALYDLVEDLNAQTGEEFTAE
jgi:hypothetical protein